MLEGDVPCQAFENPESIVLGDVNGFYTSLLSF